MSLCVFVSVHVCVFVFECVFVSVRVCMCVHVSVCERLMCVYVCLSVS